MSLNKNLVTRAVGVEDIVLLEVHPHALVADDWILMCSDGLSDMLDDARIAEVLRGHNQVADAAHALVEAANEAGGRDNIAVILVAVRAAASAGRAWWPFRR
jgi:protein phosphatase